MTLAQRLYQFPLGVFGIAIATAIFPALAAAYVPRGANALGPRRGPAVTMMRADAFSDIVRRGLRLTVFIGLPASVGLILVRVPLTRVFFEHGSFTQSGCAADRNAGGGVLLGRLGVFHDARADPGVLCRRRRDDAAAGEPGDGGVEPDAEPDVDLAARGGGAGVWSTAIGAAVQVVLLLWLVRRHVDRPVDAAVLQGWVQVAGLSAVMGAVLYLGGGAAGPAGIRRGEAVILGQLALLVAVGAGVYLGGAALLRMPEMGWLRRGGHRPRPSK